MQELLIKFLDGLLDDGNEAARGLLFNLKYSESTEEFEGFIMDFFEENPTLRDQFQARLFVEDPTIGCYSDEELAELYSRPTGA